MSEKPKPDVSDLRPGPWQEVPAEILGFPLEPSEGERSELYVTRVDEERKSATFDSAPPKPKRPGS